MGIGIFYGSLMAMEPKDPGLADSLLGSQFMAPGTVPAHEQSPLLPSTLKRLKPDGTIIGLTKPLVIDDNATAAIIYGGHLIHLVQYNKPINALDLNAEQPAFLQEFTDEHQQFSQQKYLTAILSIGWYLFSEAINKGQAFIEGSFTIIDTDFKLYNFLLYYARKVNTALTGTPHDELAPGSSNPFAYSRNSSHWKKTQAAWRHYGIDMRLAEGQAALPILPANKKHLLFAIIATEPTPRLFIKFEDNGVYAGRTLADTLAQGREFFAHFGSWAITRIPKFESDVPKEIYDKIKPFVGSDDGPDARREHAPVEFARSCKEILAKSPAHKKYYKMLKEQGIGRLGELVENKPDDWSEELHAEFTRYHHELCSAFDHPEIRKGSEVILDPDELLSCLYYHCLSQNNIPKALQAGTLYEILRKHHAITERIYLATRRLEINHEQGLPRIPEKVKEMQAEVAALERTQEHLEEKAQEILDQLNTPC
jgi:hypothetical protein